MQIKDKSGLTIVPVPSLRRLTIYLPYLKELSSGVTEYVSATTIARALGYIPIQVRKDIAYTGITGKPRRGYPISELVNQLEVFLGWKSYKNTFLVGAGNLGRAIMGYPGFKDCGLQIVAAFDADPAKIGTRLFGIEILSMDEFKTLVKRMGVQLGIITAPEQSAQEIADIMVDAGIHGIWNFAPVKLNIPDDVIVQNENLASSLTVLSKKLDQIV